MNYSVNNNFCNRETAKDIIDFCLKFGEVTDKDFLISLDPTDSDLWEVSSKWTNISEKHPNAKGNQKISDELYDFIIKSNIIKKNKSIIKML